ncbi:MAG: tetratricopeptide repeat protein, partial [Planctomycetota bacterium]
EQVDKSIELLCESPTLSINLVDDANPTPRNRDSNQSESLSIEEEIPTRIDQGDDTPIHLTPEHKTLSITESGKVAHQHFPITVYRSFAEKIAQIADALQYASDEGVVHRDVKPGNILVDGHGKFYLADFGLAKIHDPQSDQSTACVGTPGYIAPERLRGQSSIDPRSDIYALGLVLEQLVTLSNQSPLTESTTDDSQRFDSLNAVPKPLRRIIKAATAEDLNERYESAGEFAKDLRRFAIGDPVLIGAQSRLDAWISAMRGPKFQRALVAVCFMVLVASVSYLIVYNIQTKQKERLASIQSDATATIFMDMVDSVYLRFVDDLVQSAIGGGRGGRPLQTTPVDDEKRGELLEGIGHLRQLAVTHSDNPPTILRIAQTIGRIGFVLESSGFSHDAEELYKEADGLLVGLGSIGPNAAIERCWIAYHRANWQHRRFGYGHAESAYERVLQLAGPYLLSDDMDEETAARLHEIVGITLLAQENFKDAVDHLEIAASGDTARNSTLLALATAYRMMGRYREALPIAATCAVENPESAYCLRNLAAIQMHLDEIDEAAKNYERCLQIDPNHVLALQGLAWARHRQGRTEDALEHVNKAVEISPADEVILTTRGVLSADLFHFEDAVDDLKKAYEFRPGSGYVASKLFPALLFFPDPDVELASKLLTRDQRKLPPAVYQFAEALVDYSKGRYRQAAAAFEMLPNGFDGRPPDQRGATFAWLCKIRSTSSTADERNEAVAELQIQQENRWPHFGVSPFDEAMIRHIDAFLIDYLNN